MSHNDDTDPSGWSDEQLDRHARIWCELPIMPGITRTLSDEDAEAHGDLLYIAGMVDDLTAAKAELTKEVQDFKAEHGTYPAEPVMWLQFLAHSAEMWLSSTLSFSDPWPEDRAAVLLAEWRNEDEAAA